MDSERGCIVELGMIGLVLAVILAATVILANGMPNLEATGLTWDTSSVQMREQQRTERERIRAAAEIRLAEESAETQRWFWVAVTVIAVVGLGTYAYTRRPVRQQAQPPMLMVVYAGQLPAATVELIEGEWRLLDHQQRTYLTERDVRGLIGVSRETR